MSLRRGIEPIIATVILVAVALIIAVAVVGYLMGLFGGLTGGQPQISITNVIAKTVEGQAKGIKVELYLVNSGSGSDRMLKAELLYNNTVFTNSTTITIPGNQRGWQTIFFSSQQQQVSLPSAGDTVIIKLYFERSGIQTINVVVSPS